MSRLDVVVVGAGFSGAVTAERLAERGLKVLVMDRRLHIGGNAYDSYDRAGVLIHPYGPHIFHTNSERIVDYLSRFTRWRPYEHRVRAKVGEQLLPIPINIDTVNRLYGLDLDETSIQAFYDRVREPRAEIRTSEDVVLNAVGRDLYEKFFRGYTFKQWGVYPSDLSAAVTARIPTRTNRDDRYFTDSFQCMPAEGFTRMFRQMLDHPNIRVETGTDYLPRRARVKALHTVYTGPVDAYFQYCHGKLPYRSIQFEHEHLPGTQRHQPVAVVNYPNDHDYTRITEFRHLTGQEHSGTSIVREYPCAEGDPYYPVPRPENEALYKRYEAMALAERDVSFVGRLATYRYYNMDQCVGAALKAADRILAQLRPSGAPIPIRRPAALPGSAPQRRPAAEA